MIVSLLSLVHDRAQIYSDFFAGSGTTGHAVLEMNKIDGGNRKLSFGAITKITMAEAADCRIGL